MGILRGKPDIDSMLKKLGKLPFGDERVALCEKGITAAALAENDEAGFAFRDDLLDNCVLGGMLHRAIPAMEWCLARCDADPERFDVKRILFKYKWILEELPKHTRFEANTIDAGLADIERRFSTTGWGPRGPLELRMVVAWTMRRPELGDSIFPRWRVAPVDEGADCPACAAAHEVRYLLNADRDEEAVAAAGPLLSGSLDCMEEPARCFSRLQFALADLGREKEAFEAHRRSTEAVLAGPQFADARVNHMVFLLCSGNFDLAGHVLEIALPQALVGDELGLLMTCETGSAVLEVLRRRRMDMPSFEPEPAVGVASSFDWPDWMAEQRLRLAAAFDERNGNTAFADDRARFEQMIEDLATREI
jgi:hypothetical protein